MRSSHLIFCHPLLLLPPIPPSIRVFSNESTLRMRWQKYWSFSFIIIPSKEHPGLVSFRMDWLDLLAVQGILKNLLQYHSSKASILQRSAFFTVQLSHPYMTSGKPIALTRQTFVGKVMSLHLNMLSRLVITILPRSKHLLISWLQSPATPRPRSGAAARRSYPTSKEQWMCGHRRAKRSYPTYEVRGSGWECQTATAQERPRRATQAHVQGAVAVRVQEGLEELSHIEGQEGQR